VTSVDPCIAIVDDEAPVRTMLGRVLRVADYDVATYASGEEFLASLTTRVPSCLILDVHMPGLSGFDVQSRLRALGPAIPVIFITASDDSALDERVKDAHGTVLLRKPFTSDTLLSAIAVALKGRPCGGR
jgi:FixJ family two-component response regulator